MNVETQIGPYTIQRPIARWTLAERFVVTSPRGDTLWLDRLWPEFRRLHSFDAELDRIRGWGRVKHPAISRVVDVGESGDHLWVVTESMEGRSLEALLQRPQQSAAFLTRTRVLEMALQLVGALSAVHETTDEDGWSLGLSHGGLTPGHVLVDREGRVKIAGGWATRLEARIAWALPPRVAVYHPPETVWGTGPLSPASDLYSLGVILLEALTMRRFEGSQQEESSALVRRLLRRDPEEALEGSGLSGAVLTLLRSLLAQNAADRPTDAREVEDQLRELLGLDVPSRVQSQPAVVAPPEAVAPPTPEPARVEVAAEVRLPSPVVEPAPPTPEVMAVKAPEVEPPAPVEESAPAEVDRHTPPETPTAEPAEEPAPAITAVELPVDVPATPGALEDVPAPVALERGEEPAASPWPSDLVPDPRGGSPTSTPLPYTFEHGQAAPEMVATSIIKREALTAARTVKLDDTDDDDSDMVVRPNQPITRAPEPRATPPVRGPSPAAERSENSRLRSTWQEEDFPSYHESRPSPAAEREPEPAPAPVRVLPDWAMDPEPPEPEVSPAPVMVAPVVAPAPEEVPPPRPVEPEVDEPADFEPLALQETLSEAPRAILIFREGSPEERRYPLAGERVTLGRSSDNTYQILKEVKASRFHCEFRITAGAIHVADRKSTNGTYVNGRPIHEHGLKGGEKITIGYTTFKFVRLDEDGREVGAAKPRILTREDTSRPLPKAFLTRFQHTEKEQVVPIEGEVFLIGSSKDMNLVLKDSKVAPSHCQIRVEGKHYVIEDHLSEHGTLVNGFLVDQLVLSGNEEVTFGDQKFRFELMN